MARLVELLVLVGGVPPVDAARTLVVMMGSLSMDLGTAEKSECPFMGMQGQGGARQDYLSIV